MKSSGLRFLFALGMAISLSALAGGAPLQTNTSDVEVQQRFRAALQAQRAGKLEAAAGEYQAVIRLQPHLAEAYANLGLIYYLQLKFEKSVHALAKATALKPGLRGTNLFLGMDYLKLNRPRAALPYLKRAVQNEPRNKQAALSLGTALWNSGQRLAALRRLRATAREFPRDADVLFALGEAYQKSANNELDKTLTEAGLATPLYEQVSGDIYAEQRAWERAIVCYKRASEEDPQWKGAHLGIGTVLLREGKLNDAGSEFRQELKIDPASSRALARLAEALILGGHSSQGLQALGRAIRIAPDQAAHALGLPAPPPSESKLGTAGSRYESSLPALEAASASAARSLALAAWYAQLGPAAAYETAWRDFRARAPHTRSSDPYQQALADFDQHNFEAAEAKLVPLLAAKPNDAKTRHLLARTDEHLSLAVLSRMFQLDPNSYRVHQLLGRLYEYRWQSEKAIAEYETALRLHSTVSGVHLAIGEVLWKEEKLEPAIAEFKAEIKLNPYDARPYAEIGTILATRHESEQAIPYLTRAIQLQPDMLLVHRYLGLAYLQQKNYARAEEELKQALPIDHDGAVHYLLGAVYRDLGRPKEAIAEMEEARLLQANSEHRAEVKNESAASLKP